MIPLRDDNPTRSFPVITVVIIAVNVLVFLYELSIQKTLTGLVFMDSYAMIPANVIHQAGSHEYLTLLTSMFLHAGFLHLAGNMLYLWIFGNNVEDAMGWFRYILFYSICGIAAAGAHLLSNPNSEIPVVGASGAISGVLGAYLLLFPKARVMTLVPMGYYSRLIYLPSWTLLIFWFAIQLFSGWFTGSEEGAGVAWWAHIGGFIAGVALIPIFKQREVPLLGRGNGTGFSGEI